MGVCECSHATGAHAGGVGICRACYAGSGFCNGYRSGAGEQRASSADRMLTEYPAEVSVTPTGGATSPRSAGPQLPLSIPVAKPERVVGFICVRSGKGRGCHPIKASELAVPPPPRYGPQPRACGLCGGEHARLYLSGWRCPRCAPAAQPCPDPERTAEALRRRRRDSLEALV